MSIKSNIDKTIKQINDCCAAVDRDPRSVLLLAVSKTQSAATVAEAYQTGLRHFGENYCQEALLKQQALGAYDISWHFIGPIQSNKTKLIAQHFSWVHSVDSLKIAKRLSQHRPAHLPLLNICLQVNISEEDSKSGVNLRELAETYQEINGLPRLKLRGVMAIPAPQDDIDAQRLPYRLLRNAALALNKPEIDTFSFGMSGDLAAAITEGATIVRIGTALFGQRTKPNSPKH